MSKLRDGYAAIKFNPSMDEATKSSELAKFFSPDNTKSLLSSLAGKIKGDFFLGGAVSLADVVYFSGHEYLVACHPSIESEYPALAKVYKSVAAVPAVKKY